MDKRILKLRNSRVFDELATLALDFHKVRIYITCQVKIKICEKLLTVPTIWSHAGRYFYDPFLVGSENSEQLLSAQIQDVTDFFDRYLKAEANTPPDTRNLIRYYTFGEGK